MAPATPHPRVRNTEQGFKSRIALAPTRIHLYPGEE